MGVVQKGTNGAYLKTPPHIYCNAKGAGGGILNFRMTNACVGLENISQLGKSLKYHACK